ncbi:hypothetical protein RQM65_11455 [Pricia sp. S334]|uniref:Secreted protein n=1 Tax=Pricia mediterranea TaxID=3076079 RepID=A0ABU3L7X2_9FLAO|nr:hypothetical protein [Pricia sp. S334]MDT7829284.1 hypothetical protein [Pricia sp. S334]
MTKGLHRILSVAMTLLLLVATTSWTVGRHYCMGRLMDVSLFEVPEGCCSEMAPDGDGRISLVVVDDGLEIPLEDSGACCSDEVVSLAGRDDLRLSYNELGLDQPLFWDAVAHSYPLLLQTTTERHVPNVHYPSPVLVKDIQLLDGEFLI